MKFSNIHFSKTLLIKYSLGIIMCAAIFACKKQSSATGLHYYEIGTKTPPPDWRDSIFIVATGNAGLVAEINQQLALPVAQRKMVSGKLVAGSGGYNKNAGHEFAWHFKEDNWQLAELSAEIYDGRPYSDLDIDIHYWLDTVERFAPWQAYIKREVLQQ
ncbi:MAG: hypothetical protein ABUT20_62790 [Bacteroidota bacterium]